MSKSQITKWEKWVGYTFMILVFLMLSGPTKFEWRFEIVGIMIFLFLIFLVYAYSIHKKSGSHTDFLKRKFAAFIVSIIITGYLFLEYADLI